MIPKYQKGDKVIITEGIHKGKVGAIANVTVTDTAILYLVDGITKPLRMYLGSQLEPAPPKGPITDPLSLRASRIFMGLE